MEVDDNSADEREKLEQKIQCIANKQLRRLFELWRLIGVKPIDSRIQDVEKHFEALLEKLVSEEEKHLDKITKNIQRYELERLEIRRDLNVFVDNEDSFEAALSLIDVEFKLRT